MKTDPLAEVPAPEAELHAAHDRLLRDAVDLLDRARPPIRTVGDRMILLLAGRVLQLGRALHLLCSQGYAGEAGPIARAMLSACVIVAYITEDRDGRTIAYIKEDHRVRIDRIEDLERERKKAIDSGKEFFVPDSEMQAIKAKLVEVEAMEAGKLEALGITPTKLGTAKTWTGLGTERERFDRMNALRWYLTFYKLFSDETHINANSLAGELAEQVTGTSSFGPKYGDVLTIHLIKASAETVLNALEQVSLAFTLKKEADVRALSGRIGAAITQYAKAIAAPVAQTSA